MWQRWWSPYLVGILQFNLFFHPLVTGEVRYPTCLFLFYYFCRGSGSKFRAPFSLNLQLTPEPQTLNMKRVVKGLGFRV